MITSSSGTNFAEYVLSQTLHRVSYIPYWLSLYISQLQCKELWKSS